VQISLQCSSSLGAANYDLQLSENNGFIAGTASVQYSPVGGGAQFTCQYNYVTGTID
jgi:hypothetical protein